METDLSRAVVLYLGFGSAPSPQANGSTLTREFGAERGAELLERVVDLLDEVREIQIDWPIHSLASAGDAACDSMRGRHPELSEEALRALGWKFTFDWR